MSFIETDTQDGAQDTDTDTSTDTDTDTDTSGEGDTSKATDTRQKETPEQRVARLRRQLEREEKKLGLDKTDAQPEKKDTKTSEFDYGQKAYLHANGIKVAEERELVKELMAETGKDLEALLESKYFQARLKEFREDKAAADAIPSGTKRAQSSTKDSVEYWIARGELPPNTPENRELRTKVVNAKLAKSTTGDKFSSVPVVK